MPGKASIQVCWELFSTFHWVAFAKLPRHISRVLRGPFSKGKAMMRSRKHCHTRLVETGAYILVFSVTNFWSALSVASQIFIWGSHFCGAMKFLALCRWCLEAAFMKCGMGVHWFYWFTMVTRCMRWCCSLTGVSMQIELTLCVMSVPLHLWKRFFVFAKCG